MLSFFTYINESTDYDLTKGEMGMPKTLHDFLWHLTSPNFHGEGSGPIHQKEIHGTVPLIENFEQFLESHDVVFAVDKKTPLDHPHHPLNIIRRGIQYENEMIRKHNDENEERKKSGFHTLPYHTPHKRLDNAVHKVFDVTDQKEKKRLLNESKEHFRQFMAKEGGHSIKSQLTMMSQNQKTASSSTRGRNTIGLSIAPHSLGTVDPTGEVKHVGQHWNVCPKASEKCKENCLGTSAGGNRQYPVAALRAKVLRQRYLTEHPEHAVRLLSHEIEQNENWCSKHHSIHNEKGEIVGHMNKKSGKIETDSSEDSNTINEKIKSGKYRVSDKHMESGVRLNVTSDIPWFKLGEGKIMKHHPNTKFYDYTKNTSTIRSVADHPQNFTCSLSHTGDGHDESNSHDAVEHLRNGGIVSMVYGRGKGVVQPKRVKAIGSKEGEDEWFVANGDNDDNIDHRHDQAADYYNDLAEHHSLRSKNAEGDEKHQHLELSNKYKHLSNQYRQRKIGVVSGLKLKGVTNEDAGNFVNHVDDTGTIWINSKKHKFIPLAQSK